MPRLPPGRMSFRHTQRCPHRESSNFGTAGGDLGPVCEPVGSGRARIRLRPACGKNPGWPLTAAKCAIGDRVPGIRIEEDDENMPIDVLLGDGTSGTPAVDHDHCALMGPFIGAQQFVGCTVYPRVFRRRDNDILGRVEVELPAAQAAVALIAAEEAAEHLLHTAVGEEEHNVSLAR